MKLIHSATGKEVKIGDKVQYRHHNAPPDAPFETLEVRIIQKPHHGGSTGRVYAAAPGKPTGGGFFPSVYDMEWTEREDQQ